MALDLKGAIASAMSQYRPLDLTDPGTLLRNLVFVYHTMRASEHLLQVAVERSAPGPLRDYFTEHLEEERGHERWLADDLAAVGIDVAMTAIPRQAVELVGSQYYLIHHVSPAALLGYMALMECFSVPLDHLDRLEALHGKTLFRCARFHAEHDIDHGNDLLRAFEQLPPNEQALAVESGVQSAHYFGTAMATFALNTPNAGEPKEWH